MSRPHFSVRKAAQVTAFFANRQGRRISILKLVKLIYLADRESMRDFGHPILDDEFVSTPHGPVNSITYNYINGMFGTSKEWEQFVGRRFGNNVGATRTFNTDDLDELSEADLATLEKVWAGFGSLDAFALRDWTHNNCPEWEDPNGSSSPIPHERIFKFLGHIDSEELTEAIQQSRTIEEVFESLRR